MGSSRREFLRVTGGAALLLGAGRSVMKASDGPAELHVRKDVATLDANSPDIIALQAAVQKMKSGAGLGADDKRRWESHASIHGTFAKGFKACQHGNWYFLPWHRGYLYHFEELVRHFSGTDDFALPYWDWTKDRSLPALFWGGNNPLDNPRVQGVNQGRSVVQDSTVPDADYNRFLHKNVISRILRTDDWETFAGAETGDPPQHIAQGELESTPHNFIHRWVGGDMTTAESSYDPIFFLHHCNIDRLWSEWAARHPSATPTDRDWLSHEFRDFYDRDGEETGIKVERTLETASLGYRYDSRPESVNVVPKRAQLAVFTPSLRAESSLTSFGAWSSHLTATPELASRLTDIAEAPADKSKMTARMVIQGLVPPGNEDVCLDVFFNCEKLSEETPITDPSYLGSRTFFLSSGQDTDHHNGGVSFLFDLNPTIAKLYGGRPLKPDEPFKVSLVARPLGDDKAKGRIIPLKPAQVSIQIVRPKAS